MTKKNPHISVVGSLNVDLTAYVETLPRPGQTITSQDFIVFPGGKGANQAVAASKLGASVSMFGCIGLDSHSQILLDSLSSVGVSVANVRSQKGLYTGMALILVEDSSENEIVVVPGANAEFSPEVLEQMDVSRIEQSDALLLQHEIPIATVLKAAQIAHRASVPVILNPAPARELSQELLKHVDILIPNQSELEKLLSNGFTMEQLFSLGIQSVLETRGANGVLVHTKDTSHHVNAVKVNAIDTVGAGDTFVAAFAVAFSSGADLLEAVQYANHAAAYSTTRKGAQSSFPTTQELEEIGVKLH